MSLLHQMVGQYLDREHIKDFMVIFLEHVAKRAIKNKQHLY
jgi:hypothetical protein